MAEDESDYRKAREVLRTKAQSNLIDFLNTEMDLALTFLQTADLEKGDDQERYQMAIGNVRSALETVRRFESRIEDPASLKLIHRKVDDLEAQLHRCTEQAVDPSANRET